MSINWLSWSATAFEKARSEGKPVVLSLAAAWCPTCHEMDRTTYADPAVVACITERFVAVRVEADERPDVCDRYSLGGLPTTAFLTADAEVLGGGTFVPPHRMRAVLAQVLERAASGDPPHASGESRMPNPEPQLTSAASRAPTPESRLHDQGPRGVTALTEMVFESADVLHGGFGTAPKFPLVAPVRLALGLWEESREARIERLIVRTLDAIGWGSLYDEAEGGFFQYAETADWRVPHTAKLLDVNAELVRLFLDAGAALGIGRFTERAACAVDYVQAHLADHDAGGWFAFQEADDAYYAAAARERESLAAPPVATAACADSSGLMVSAGLRAASVFGDEGLRSFAMQSLERVTLSGYRPGRGVAHCVDGQARTRGLLADQIRIITAHLDAFEATGNVVFEMLAEELGRFVIRTMWDDLDAGFFDRAATELDDEPRGSRVRARTKPFVINCEAASAFARLAAASGDSAFSHHASRALEAAQPFAGSHGPLAAHYLLAVRAVGGR